LILFLTVMRLICVWQDAALAIARRELQRDRP